MNKIRFALSSLTVLFFMLTLMPETKAQNAFVKSTGSGSTCSSALPCRELSTAMTAVGAGYTIFVMDSADFNTFTIAKSVQIIGPVGGYATIKVDSNNLTGINISGAGGSDVIKLRGLMVNTGYSGSTIGIYVNSGGAVFIENCLIDGMDLGITMSVAANLHVTDTTVRNCNINASSAGIKTTNTSGTAKLLVDNVRLERNSECLWIDGTGGGVKGIIRNTVATGGSEGFWVANGTNDVSIENCVAMDHTGGGIRADSGSTTTVRVSNSTVTNCYYGLDAGGSSSLLSRSNNTVEANGTNTYGTSTYTAK